MKTRQAAEQKPRSLDMARSSAARTSLTLVPFPRAIGRAHAPLQHHADLGIRVRRCPEVGAGSVAPQVGAGGSTLLQPATIQQLEVPVRSVVHQHRFVERDVAHAAVDTDGLGYAQAVLLEEE